VYVHPDAARTGVGSAILVNLEEWARGRPSQSVATISNSVAIAGVEMPKKTNR